MIGKNSNLVNAFFLSQDEHDDMYHTYYYLVSGIGKILMTKKLDFCTLYIA
jgi:hypothetical protein